MILAFVNRRPSRIPADDAALGYDRRNSTVEVRDPPMKVLIVDDHPLIRSGVKAMLVRHERRVLVREARQLGEALGMLEEVNGAPDLILLDLNLPDCSGLPTLTAIREAAPCTPVVVLSADDSKSTILGSLDRGALGFIPKTMSPDLIWSALGLVLAGGVYVPHKVIFDAGKLDAAEPGRPGTLGRVAVLHSLGLTERQIDTLRMLVQGLPNKSIARNLGITEATVKVYVSAVLRALNVTSRTQAVIWLSQNDIKFEGGGASPGESESDLN